MNTIWSSLLFFCCIFLPENAYKVTLACAFVPLVIGLYWKRATRLGAGLAIVLGLVVWITMGFIAPDAALPPQFAGLFAGALGMGAELVWQPNDEAECRSNLQLGVAP